MKLLITGACGFVGSRLIGRWRSLGASHAIVGMDNLSREGCEVNRAALRRAGVHVVHGDLRCRSDVEALPPAEFVVDAAAVPSVRAGIDGQTSTRQLIEHNLLATVNLLEYCRSTGAGLALLSTSRVYSIAALNALPLAVGGQRFDLLGSQPLPPGTSSHGLDESFSTEPPLSLYGASKLTSEQLAREYGEAFGFPVWINRCGMMAGPGQFGRAEQGVISFWVHAWRAGLPLSYHGYGGAGLRCVTCSTRRTW